MMKKLYKGGFFIGIPMPNVSGDTKHNILWEIRRQVREHREYPIQMKKERERWGNHWEKRVFTFGEWFGNCGDVFFRGRAQEEFLIWGVFGDEVFEMGRG